MKRHNCGEWEVKKTLEAPAGYPSPILLEEDFVIDDGIGEAVRAYSTAVISPNLEKNLEGTYNRKSDTGKVDLAALPLGALGVVARVFEHGNRKYGEDNWLSQDVATKRRYVAACLRHLAAVQTGQLLDESGLPHLAHAIASLLIALHHETQPKAKGLWDGA